MMQIAALSRLELRKQKRTLVSTLATVFAGLAVAFIILVVQRKWPMSELLFICSTILIYATPFIGLVLASSAAGGLLQEQACHSEENLPLSRFRRLIAAYKVSLLYFLASVLAIALIPNNFSLLMQLKSEPSTMIALVLFSLLWLFKLHLFGFVTTYLTRLSFLSSALTVLSLVMGLPTTLLFPPMAFGRASVLLTAGTLSLELLTIAAVYLAAKSASRRFHTGAKHNAFRWVVAIAIWLSSPLIQTLSILALIFTYE